MSLSPSPRNDAQSSSAAAINAAVRAGLAPLDVSEPLTLSEWAEQHFYLSAESSYTDSRWSSYPYQTAILDAIGHDDIQEVNLMKSARVGYTKMILAAVGYFAHHKHRNQALWQPTDADRDEFSKVELDPMIRDVAVMASIFPTYLRRHKDNTITAKKFLTGMLFLRGGTSAKSYRRISVDVCYLDELDAFDQDIEGEGSPFQLAKKRTEGSIFPKVIAGTTPKTAGSSHIEDRVNQSEHTFHFHVPCPSCHHEHTLTWGGRADKKLPSGFIWRDNDPTTVGHLCPACGIVYSQQDYLSVWYDGVWLDPDTGVRIGKRGLFLGPDGETIAPPAHVAFRVWSAYSPQASWHGIVREYLNTGRTLGGGGRAG
jgi:phage terminase large subunit GpA-like protein